MKQLFISFFLIFSFSAFAQQVVKTSVSACDHRSDPYFMYQNRLISKEIINDTLNLQIGIVRNCEFFPEIKVEYNSDSLVLDIQNSSELYAACECCFEMNIQLVGIPDTNFTLYNVFEATDFNKSDGFIEWTEIRKMRYHQSKYVLPTPEQIKNFAAKNKLNENGLKVGPWEIVGESGRKYKAFFAIDDSGRSRAKWSIAYDEKGELTEVCGKQDDSNESTCADAYEYKKFLELQTK